LFDALRGAGENPIEVFPDAAFRRLAGRLGPLAKKGTRVGSEERARLLSQLGVKTAGLELWSTHCIDGTRFGCRCPNGAYWRSNSSNLRPRRLRDLDPEGSGDPDSGLTRFRGVSMLLWRR